MPIHGDLITVVKQETGVDWVAVSNLINEGTVNEENGYEKTPLQAMLEVLKQLIADEKAHALLGNHSTIMQQSQPTLE